MATNLQARILTLSVPYEGCNKKCGYCVSRMTGSIEKNVELWRRNLIKAENLARSAGAPTILMTGKGEPLHPGCRGYLEQIGEIFGTRWPLEIQTNGGYLAGSRGEIGVLYNLGFNLVAVSMDHQKQFEEFGQVFAGIAEAGMAARMTVNVNVQLGELADMDRLLEYCMSFRIRQLTLRRLTVPEGAGHTEQAAWIAEHAPGDLYQGLTEKALALVERKGRVIRRLADGLRVYDIGGVAFVHSDYCLQEQDEGHNIRSLIYQEDGHMYTSWNSMASLLF